MHRDIVMMLYKVIQALGIPNGKTPPQNSVHTYPGHRIHTNFSIEPCVRSRCMWATKRRTMTGAADMSVTAWLAAVFSCCFVAPPVAGFALLFAGAPRVI